MRASQSITPASISSCRSSRGRRRRLAWRRYANKATVDGLHSAIRFNLTDLRVQEAADQAYGAIVPQWPSGAKGEAWGRFGRLDAAALTTYPKTRHNSWLLKEQPPDRFPT